MSDPRRAEVWGKKSEVADRTLNERKYCKVCDYYYSEMFTCPICYGADRENERIIELLKNYAQKELERLRNPNTKIMTEEHLAYYEGLLEAMFLIKGEQK